MSRRVRHVHARPGEHIYVHRHDHPRYRPTPVYTPAGPTFGDMVRSFSGFSKNCSIGFWHCSFSLFLSEFSVRNNPI